MYEEYRYKYFSFSKVKQKQPGLECGTSPLSFIGGTAFCNKGSATTKMLALIDKTLFSQTYSSRDWELSKDCRGKQAGRIYISQVQTNLK